MLRIYFMVHQRRLEVLELDRTINFLATKILTGRDLDYRDGTLSFVEYIGDPKSLVSLGPYFLEGKSPS
jgi:hypothetical protein